MDLHDIRLQNEAQYMALKMGHRLNPWTLYVIVYGGGKKKRKRYVQTYLTDCRYCGAEVRVSTGLQDHIQGMLLEEPCMQNTGYMEREYDLVTGECIRIRFDLVRNNAISYQECA